MGSNTLWDSVDIAFSHPFHWVVQVIREITCQELIIMQYNMNVTSRYKVLKYHRRDKSREKKWGSKGKKEKGRRGKLEGEEERQREKRREILSGVWFFFL